MLTDIGTWIRNAALTSLLRTPFGRKPDLRQQKKQLNKSLGFILQISQEMIYQNLIHDDMAPKARYTAFWLSSLTIFYFP